MHWLIGCLAALSFGLFSQVDDDWGIIEPIEVIAPIQQQPASFDAFWKEHGYAKLRHQVAIGSPFSDTQIENNVTLGISEQWGQTQWVLEAKHSTRWMHRDYTQTTPNGRGTHHTTQFSQALYLNQAYLVASPLKQVSLSLGKQAHVWGQLDMASPIDMFLPIDINPMVIPGLKATNRRPQTTAKLTLYPTPKVEISGYYFPTFEESKWIPSVDLSNAFTTIGADHTLVKKRLPSKHKQSSAALRAIWYAPSFTTAVTYYNGFNTLSPIMKRQYINPQLGNHDALAEYGYYQKQGLGVELHVPMQPVGVKAEMSISDAYVSIQNDHPQIIQALKTHNNGWTAIPAYVVVSAIGIDASTPTWFTNAYVFNVTHIKRSSTASFWHIYNQHANEGDAIDNVPVFPVLNIGRHFGLEKKATVGVATGVFSGVFGTSLYGAYSVNDSLRLDASVASDMHGPDAVWLAQDLTGIHGYKEFPRPSLRVSVGMEVKI
ncbi:MAG: hypothetical protein ISQ13_00895 [Candidatus Margulisbacteria bacterium]|nr:hypothetical protein [Candidatus Margulisiibacteriota bacterium]